MFGVTYRYSMWLQKPPTQMHWKRGWQTFFYCTMLPTNIVNWFKRLTVDFAGNHFIFKRGIRRWLAHFLIMWGCLIALASRFLWFGAGCTSPLCRASPTGIALTFLVSR